MAYKVIPNITSIPIVDLTAEEIRLLRKVRLWATTVNDEFKSSPGGDEFTYEGSMSSVEELKEALEDYQAFRIMNNVDIEPDMPEDFDLSEYPNQGY